jgi:hypothetical protein
MVDDVGPDAVGPLDAGTDDGAAAVVQDDGCLVRRGVPVVAAAGDGDAGAELGERAADAVQHAL